MITSLQLKHTAPKNEATAQHCQIDLKIISHIHLQVFKVAYATQLQLLVRSFLELIQINKYKSLSQWFSPASVCDLHTVYLLLDVTCQSLLECGV